MDSVQSIEKELGKKIKWTKVFKLTDPENYDDSRESFHVFDQAKTFVTDELGLDIGSTARAQPIGLMKNADIGKWYNLHAAEKKMLDGVMLSDSFREGREIKILLTYDPNDKKKKREKVKEPEYTPQHLFDFLVDRKPGHFPNKKHVEQLLAWDQSKTQWCPIEKQNMGWVSPNGIFYPCPVFQGHNELQELLQDLFKIEVNSSSFTRMKEFESKFIKVADDFYEERDKLKFVYMGKPTARQKLFIEQWVKHHRSDKVASDGVYRLFGGDVIDERFRFVPMSDRF